jgi:DNA polymerase-3 subunit gamma/tau
MLSTGAFNALLKTLEEPPEHVVFVLATTDVHKVPETIVSRCQRFDFRRLDLLQIAAQLRKVAEAEGMRVSDAALALVARAAEGGMRDALSLLDRIRAACGDAPDDAAVAEAIGAIDAAAVSRVVWALLRRDAPAILSEIQALFDRGLEMKRVADEVVRRLRDVTVARLAPSVPLELPDAERREVEAQAQAAEPVQLGRLFDLAQRAVTEVRLAEQPRYALEVALLKAALLAPGADVGELLARAEALAAGGAGGGPPAAGGAAPTGGAPPRATGAAAGGSRAAPAAEPPVAEARAPTPAGALDRPLSPGGSPGCAAGPGAPARGAGAGPAPGAPAGEAAPAPDAAGPAPGARRDDASRPLPDRWRAAVEEVAREAPSMGPALRQAALVELGDDAVRIRYPTGSSYPAMVERRRSEVERCLGAFLGRPVRLAVDVGEAPAGAGEAGAPIAAVDQAAREARTTRRHESARANPNIREAARILDAEIDRIEEL